MYVICNATDVKANNYSTKVRQRDKNILCFNIKSNLFDYVKFVISIKIYDAIMLTDNSNTYFRADNYYKI